VFFESLKILGFGCLRTEIIFSPDKLNLAIADNEAGKSTLISSLLAAFYGTVEDERMTRDKRPHRKNFLPWTDPENFGLVLDFTADDIHWRIERDFHKGSINLIDLDSGDDHIAEYHRGRGIYYIGEGLIGLSCDEFLKSFYLKQEEILDIRDAKGLTPYVQQVATTQEGGATSENAIERLRQALRHYPFPGSRDGLTIENAIKRLGSEREGVLTDMDRLNRLRSDIEPQCQRLMEIERGLEGLRRKREENERLGDLAEIRELTRLVEAQDRLQGEFQELSATAAELKSFDQFPADRWEQLNKMAGRVEELSETITNQQELLRSQGEEPLARLENELQAHRELSGITADELHEFEAGVSRLTDRRERLQEIRQEVERREERLRDEGFDRGHFSRLKGAFSAFGDRELRFVDEFRATYAEEEAVFREAKTQREWREREQGLIRDRRGRTISNARLFFIIAAVMGIAGGLMILATQGGWLGYILAGLGVVFGAVGAVILGTAGSLESSGLLKIEGELEEALRAEKEASDRLESIGGELTQMGTRAGFSDGNELLSEYVNYERLQKLSEPLFEAERDLERAVDEDRQAMDQMHPFFARAGADFPDDEEAVSAARKMLERYREMVRLSEEWTSVKARKSQLAEELSRLNRDLDSHRELCSDILKLGGIDPTEPLDEAVAAFSDALDKHRRYHTVAHESLPRVERELLPEVDLAAKKDRLKQLQIKNAGVVPPEEIDHSKEFYRDRAERGISEIERLINERSEINRKIGTTYDRFGSNYPELHKRLTELEEALHRAETFRSEVETSIRIMGDISREVYRSWADGLSRGAVPFLQALNPRYDQLNFNEDLTFSIHDRQQDRVISSSEVETILSSGARDEIFLAARLGISTYLARGARGPIPIVLDEPLSSADDDKFLTGMTFFLDMLSRSHQVLILSCHAERHRWLAKKHPKLFKERVHQIEVVAETGE